MPFNMLSRTSILRQFARHASSKKTIKKISVQLLQDVPSYGVKGEVLQVSPALMRNFLHVGNKACYITKTQGPRIPVVEFTKTREPKASKKAEAQAEQAESQVPEALSLDELSGLFSSIRSSSSNKRVQKDNEMDVEINDKDNGQLSLVFEIQDGISDTTTFELDSVPQPLNKKALAQLVYKISGIQVPEALLTVTAANGTQVSEIVERGEYRWKFGGDKGLEKKLVIY